MIFRTRPNIPKQFNIRHEFGIKNLIVGGCSFTYNNHDTASVTWPYYLRDLGGFETVLDCSLPGAGNHHISNSLLWALENDKPDPEQSLVIVMWSGCDRDDFLCPDASIKQNYPFSFSYSKNVKTGITGGQTPQAIGNTDTAFKEFSLSKDQESRAIENYLYFSNTYHVLSNLNYRFIFLRFLNAKYPSRTKHFDIRPFLPKSIQQNYDKIMFDIDDPYSYCLKNDLLWQDDFHPSANGHLSWTENILIPKLKTIF